MPLADKIIACLAPFFAVGLILFLYKFKKAERHDAKIDAERALLLKETGTPYRNDLADETVGLVLLGVPVGFFYLLLKLTPLLIPVALVAIYFKM